MATNFGRKIAITSLVRMIATRQLVMEGSLSGRPTDCRYRRYLAAKGCCHGNHFLAFYIWGAHWRHLANTTELSMCGGDAALCQITLTTCCKRIWKDLSVVIAYLQVCILKYFAVAMAVQIRIVASVFINLYN